MAINHTDCFSTNIKFWKILAIWPTRAYPRFYNYYSKAFVIIFVVIYDLLFTINFYFLPRQMDNFIEEMIFYFTELSVSSKVITFYFLHEKIVKIFEMFDSQIFQPATDDEIKIVKEAKKFNIRYWRIVTSVSVISHLNHVLSPIIVHNFLHVDLILPVCSYSFLSEKAMQRFVYPLYLYQALGIHFHVWYNVNIDTFFLGILILVIAQLDILDRKLRNIANKIMRNENLPIEQVIINRLHQAIVHFDEVGKCCALIEEVFSVTLFVQFGMASCIICICAFRFVLPAPWQYYIFLATYMFVMIIQIMMPGWFGTRIIDKSFSLSHAIYSSDWTPRSSRYKNSMTIFVERASRPLTIAGLKMFSLSLNTFTSIMKTAYSFFTLLRYIMSRE